jgi:hypothetical protein
VPTTEFANSRRGKRMHTKFLKGNPYSPEIFIRFINYIFEQISNDELAEEDVLSLGYF